MKGFSLLELVVVIAITSTLAALLLPALSGAKEKSRRAVCRNNMRQFATSCHLYGYDNNDYFPNGLDNSGNQTGMVVSDDTYSNLVMYSLNAAVLDCPNVLISTNSRINTNRRGVRVGYNYLAGVDPRTKSAGKGSGAKIYPLKLTDAGTNTLLADVNYWADSGTTVKMVAHTPTGPIVQENTTLPGTLADYAVMGGNITLLDLSVTWKSVGAMQNHDVSLDCEQAATLSCKGKW